MDWGDIGDFVSFGEVGRDQIDDASYYILIAPQNVVGSTILTNLGDMVRSLHSVNSSVRNPLVDFGCPTEVSGEKLFHVQTPALFVNFLCSSLRARMLCCIKALTFKAHCLQRSTL